MTKLTFSCLASDSTIKIGEVFSRLQTKIKTILRVSNEIWTVRMSLRVYVNSVRTNRLPAWLSRKRNTWLKMLNILSGWTLRGAKLAVSRRSTSSNGLFYYVLLHLGLIMQDNWVHERRKTNNSYSVIFTFVTFGWSRTTSQGRCLLSTYARHHATLFCLSCRSNARICSFPSSSSSFRTFHSMNNAINIEKTME